MFVDSDDTIDKNAYYVAYNKINKVNADILMFGEDKCILPNKFYKSGFDAINVPGMWALWNKLYKRKFLLDNNFELPEHAKVCHDECFNTVVFPKAKGVICIKDKFYHYRRNRNNSIQNSADIKVKANYYLVFADYVCDNWRKNGYLKNYGFWLLGRLSDFSNRIIDHLSVEDKHWYAKSLMDIIGDDIYNDSNINKLSKNKKLLLRKWTKYLKG